MATIKIALAPLSEHTQKQLTVRFDNNDKYKYTCVHGDKKCLKVRE